MEDIRLSSELSRKADALRREGGYASVLTGLEDAVDVRLREVRHQRARQIAGRIRAGLAAHGADEDEVMTDFEQFRSRLAQHGPAA